MAISSVGDTSGSGTSTVTITLPGGIATGDVVYAWGGGSQTSDADVTESSGTYTELADLYSDDGGDCNFGLYRKVQGATPDSSVTIDFVSGNGSGVAKTLSGVDNTTPEDATTTTATGINGGTPDPPSITTANADAWVIAWGGSTELDAVTNPPTNYTGLIDIQSGRNSMAAHRLIVSPGAEDPATFADITGQATDSWVAATVAVREFVPPAGPALNANPFMLLGVGRKLP